MHDPLVLSILLAAHPRRRGAEAVILTTPSLQDWALGLLLLKLWVRLVLINGLPNWCATWRVKFERVRSQGLPICLLPARSTAALFMKRS